MYGIQTEDSVLVIIDFVWERCKNVWYSNTDKFNGVGELFENDVKMYGIQTTNYSTVIHSKFENDVKMYGIQT